MVGISKKNVKKKNDCQAQIGVEFIRAWAFIRVSMVIVLPFISFIGCLSLLDIGRISGSLEQARNYPKTVGWSKTTA